MSDERRAHPRAPGVLEGSWSGSLQRVRITSLSISGCFVECMSPPRVGTRVRVDIDLPTAGPTKVVGDVVTSDQSSMGFSMRFVDLPDATREALNNAVGSLFTTSNPSEEIL